MCNQVNTFIHYIEITFRNIWKRKTQSFSAILQMMFELMCAGLVALLLGYSCGGGKT